MTGSRPDHGGLVRRATAEEVASVLSVLDAAALATDYDRVRDSVERGETLVAVRGERGGSGAVSRVTDRSDGDGSTDRMDGNSSTDRSDDDRGADRTDGDGGADRSGGNDAIDRPILGALVLDGDEIAAVAVRRRLRDQGLGTALVAAAAARRDRLVATFDGDVRPFYERLGFEVAPADGDGRFRGRLVSAVER